MGYTLEVNSTIFKNKCSLISLLIKMFISSTSKTWTVFSFMWLIYIWLVISWSVVHYIEHRIKVIKRVHDWQLICTLLLLHMETVLPLLFLSVQGCLFDVFGLHLISVSVCWCRSGEPQTYCRLQWYNFMNKLFTTLVV